MVLATAAEVAMEIVDRRGAGTPDSGRAGRSRDDNRD
jgi:hypothetical protein